MNKSLEFVSVLLTVAAFVWELQKTPSEQRLLLWVLVVSVFVAILIYLSLKYGADKIEQLNDNTQRIENLEKHFNIRKELEAINYKIATLEGMMNGKIQK